MDVSATRALVPAYFSVQAANPVEEKGISRFAHQDQAGSRMRFLGYGYEREESVYGSSGRKASDPGARGRLLDIYV